MAHSDEYLKGIEDACSSIAQMQERPVTGIEGLLPPDIFRALRAKREVLAKQIKLADAVRTCQQAGYVVTDPNA